jgi:VCBS repeat-containing protein
LRLRLDSANQNAVVTGVQELPGKVNYFIGNDPKKWRTNVTTYAKVRYRDVYPGVDLEYYGNQGGELEYDFIVAPGADPSAIALDVGAGLVPAQGRPQGSPLRIDGGGDLVISAKGGEIRFHKPQVYQEQSTVDGPQLTVPSETRKSKVVNRQSTIARRQFREGRFVLDAQNRIRLAVGPYDRSKPLVIDPELVYSTCLGGVSDSANGIAVDSSGDAYVTGTTYSDNFPTVNPFQATKKSSDTTAFVTKFNATGTALVYSTYLGGSGGDTGNAIAVDSAGSAYLTGQTCSSDFPTALPLQATLKGSCDPFVTKLNPAGTSLVYSTYLGGSSGKDTATGIAVDSSGNAYVTGAASSPDFPTANPLQPSLKGYENAFVSKLNPSGSALVYSTYLGGSDGDNGAGIAVDSSGSAYLTGATSSPDFPTVNPIQTYQSKYGETNAFVAKLNPGGSALVYSTFLGGSGGPNPGLLALGDEGLGIAVDSSGNAYLTGATWSPDFPTVNPIQTYQSKFDDSNAFVSKLNSAGSALIYSTYLGGSGCTYDLGTFMLCGDRGLGIAIDSSGVAYVAGTTASSDFPTVNAIQASNNDKGVSLPTLPYTGFVACLNAAGSALAYSTYLGGNYLAQANAIAVDSADNAHVGGGTGTGFPTVNPIQAGNGGAFVVMMSPPPAVTLLPTSLDFGTVLGGTTGPEKSVTLTPLSSASVSLSSIAASGDFALVNTATSCPYSGGTVTGGAACTIDITFTPTTTDTRSGTVTITYTGEGSPETIALSGVGMVAAANLYPASLAFGNQDEGNPSSPQVVTLTNPNTIPLTVSTVTISSGWTESNNCMPAVAASASCAIIVSFQPTVYGPQTGTLTVTDYANNSPQSVTLSGTGLTPVVSLSALSLTFAAQALSTQSAPQTITVTNTGNGALTPLTISVSGDFAETNTCAGSVAPNANCTISVTFTPATAGTRGGALTLTDNASSSPQTVTLSGTGLGPGVGLSATSLTFPSQTVSTQSGPQTITLTNTGNAALTPLTIARAGSFAEKNTCPASLSAGANCTISVNFSPLGAGSQSGTITLTDNAANSPQTIPLSGTGMDFALSSTTASQTVSAGQTANYNLAVGSEDGFAQTVNLTCTGAPSESTCTLTPNTVTLNGTASATVAVAISTTAPSLAPPQGRFLPPGMKGLRGMFWLYALFWLTSVLALAGARKRRAAWLLGAGLLVVMLWSACGGGGNHLTTSPPISGTPAGAYTVDVTATDASTSTLTHTIQLTLTVN